MAKRGRWRKGHRNHSASNFFSGAKMPTGRTESVPQTPKIHPTSSDCYPLNKLCRLCLLSNANMEPIFSYPGDITLSQRIFQCTNLEIHENEDEGIPSSICSQCKRQLDQCHEFRLLCWKNNEVLHNLHTILSPRAPSNPSTNANPVVRLQKLELNSSVLPQNTPKKVQNTPKNCDLIPLNQLYTPSTRGRRGPKVIKSSFSRDLVIRLSPISPALLKKYKKAVSSPAKKIATQTKAAVKSYALPAAKYSRNQAPSLKIVLKPTKQKITKKEPKTTKKELKTTKKEFKTTKKEPKTTKKEPKTTKKEPKTTKKEPKATKKPKAKRTEIAVPPKKRKQHFEQSPVVTPAIVACTLCTQTFSNQKNLSRHMATHDNDLLIATLNRKQSRVFNCDICKKEYLKAAHFTDHLRSAEHVRNAGSSAPDEADVSILPDEAESSVQPEVQEAEEAAEEPVESQQKDDTEQLQPLPDTNDLCDQLESITDDYPEETPQFTETPVNPNPIPVDSDSASSLGDGVQYSEVCSTNNAESLFNKLKGDARNDTRRVSFADIAEIVD